MNIVVVVAHGLNCHWLGPYGNEWVATPAFDSLAGESIVFDRHFATDPSAAGFTTTCLAPLCSGLRQQRVSTTLIDDRRSDSNATLGWDRVLRTDPKSFPTPGDALAATFATALDQLPRDAPWLLWIDTDRLLPPWDFEFETYQQYAEESGGFIEARSTENEEPIDEPQQGSIDRDDDALWHRLHNSFAAAVTSFDAELANLRDTLRRRGLDRTAAFIVTSSYGWPLGEHGVVGPETSALHEELIHLPLIIRLPEAREAMRRVAEFTQPSDLPTAILELIRGNSSESRIGRLLLGQSTDVRESCRIVQGDERALRTHDWAYFAASQTKVPRLYRKPDDLWEVNDLAARHTDECDRLLELLNAEETK